ncbi:MAG: hypothetical protein NTY14_02355 [Candidatus Omnitrophica bacterium]|nr:hypothetical protein [Candidatus Omnitrophota bacterium]
MKKAQSTLEYVITITVIIAAIMAASSNFGSKVQQGTQAAVGSINGLLDADPSISTGN